MTEVGQLPQYPNLPHDSPLTPVGVAQLPPVYYFHGVLVARCTLNALMDTREGTRAQPGRECQ